MKTLILLAAFTLVASAQGLIDADGTRWKHVATGYPKDGKKFGLYVQMPIGGSKQYPVVRARKDAGPVRTVSLDCKARKVKAQGEEWVKAPPGSVGALLLKFACK